MSSAPLLTLDAPKPRWEFKGSTSATALLLASCGIGSGMLTLPKTIEQSGPRVGVILMVLALLLSLGSSVVIFLGSIRLQSGTFGGLLDEALGYRITCCGLSLLDSIFFLFLTSCLVSFLDLLGDFIPAAVYVLAGWQLLDRAVSICGSAVFIAAFTLVNRMNFLRHIASLGLLAVLSTGGVVLVKAATMIPEQGDAIGEAWNAPMELSWNTLRASGNIVFAFGMGVNIPSIAAEMRQPSTRSVFVVCFIANMIMVFFYSTIAFVVYFSFAATGVSPDFTQSYSERDSSMAICRGMLIITMLSTATLSFIPAMQSLYAVLGYLRSKPVGYEPTFISRALCVSVLMLLCAAAALNLENINVLISWLGALFGAPEMLLPPIILIYNQKVFQLSGICLAMAVITDLACLGLLWAAAVSDMMTIGVT